MNPLLNVNANISTNKKEFEAERTEYSAFKNQIDPILKHLQAIANQGWFTRYFYTAPPTVKSLNEALKSCKKMEEFEIRLIKIEGLIENFDPKNGAISFLELNREFHVLHEAILKCRIDVVSNIIKCDATAAAPLGALSQKYADKVQTIRAKLDELERLYRVVDSDFSGAYELKADPTKAKKLSPSQARIQRLNTHLNNNYNLDLQGALEVERAKIAEIYAKIGSAKTFNELEQFKNDLLVQQQLYDQAVMNFVNPKRGDPLVRGFMDEIEADMTARAKEIRAAGRSIGTWETKQWGMLLMPTDKKEAVAHFVGQGFADTMSKLKNRKHEIKRKLTEVNSIKNTIGTLNAELKQIEADLAVPINRKVAIEREMRELDRQRNKKNRTFMGKEISTVNGAIDVKDVYADIPLTPQEIEVINAKYRPLEEELRKVKLDIAKPENRKTEIKEQIRKLELKIEPFKVLEVELQEINRTLYHCILTRSLDVIAEKEWQIRQPNLDKTQKAELQYDLLKLNSKFESILEKYSNLPKQTRSLNKALTEEAKNLFLSVISCGFYNGKLDTIDEIIAKKQYADVGYSMMNYLPKWLDETKIPAGETASSYMLSQINEFTKWARHNPNKASLMASDMALTVMLLTQEKNMVKQFYAQLTARSYAMAFIAPLGAPTWSEMDKENELKFRALADFSRYVPPLAAAGSNVAEQLLSGNINPISLLAEAWKGGAGATLNQRGNELIKSDYVEVANAIVGILAGNSYRHVLETQQNIELVRLAGITRQTLTNPLSFVDNAVRNLRIWWHTITKAPLVEKLSRATVQVVIPAAIASIGLFFIGVAIVGGPAVWFTALGWALATFIFSGTFLWRSNSFMNALFPQSYEKAYEEVTAVPRNEVKLKFIATQGKKIKKMRQEYIIELEAARQLPVITPPKTLTLNHVQTTAAYAIADSMKKNVMKKLQAPNELPKNDPSGFLTETLKLETPDPVELLNMNFKVNDALKEAQKLISADPVLKLVRPADQRNLAGFLCSRIANELIEEWLNPRLEDRWIEQAVDAIIEKEDAHVEEDNPDIEEEDPDIEEQEPEVMETLESRKKTVIKKELEKKGIIADDIEDALTAAENAVNTNRQGLRRRWVDRRRRKREPLGGPDF